MPCGLLDRVLYEGKTQQLANTERGQAQAHCICMGTAISGCPQVAVQSWRGQEFPLLPCAPLFCGTIQPNQILLFFFFPNSWRWPRHSFPLIIKYTFSFQYSGSQELKFKLEHWNTQLKSPVGHLWCWRWCTQPGPVQGLDSTGSPFSRTPLWKLSRPCQLQQPTLPTANVSHIGRSLNIMPKCNTRPDAIKKKKKKKKSITIIMHEKAWKVKIFQDLSINGLPSELPLCLLSLITYVAIHDWQ